MAYKELMLSSQQMMCPVFLAAETPPPLPLRMRWTCHPSPGAPIKPGEGERRPVLSTKYDSDDDDDNDAGKERENGRRCPRIYFDNDDEEVVSVYRCIIHGKRVRIDILVSFLQKN